MTATTPTIPATAIPPATQIPVPAGHPLAAPPAPLPAPGPDVPSPVPDPMQSPPFPLRASLAPQGAQPARIDGAWWPYSRDLTAELPALTGLLDTRWGRITHVTVNPAHWPVIPHKVQVADHVVKVGWFAQEQDPHQLMLLSYRTGRWDLLVIPPETPEGTATWLMAAAADPRRSSAGTALMAEAAAWQADDRAADTGETVWESEGGRSLPPVARVASTAA